MDARFCLRSRDIQGLIKVPEDIVDIFKPDTQADEIGGYAGAELLLFVELAVSGRSRVDRQALGVAHVGQVAEQFQALDELLSSRQAAVNSKTEDGACALGQIFLR